MTTDIEKLSKQAAEALGVPEKRSYPTGGYGSSVHQFNVTYREVWLAEDSGRCAEVAADRRISTNFVSDRYVQANWLAPLTKKNYVDINLADHNNERIKAYCVAVLKAVIEQAKQEDFARIDDSDLEAWHNDRDCR